MTTKTVAAAEFKQGCLALLDEVAAGGVELVVTKRGRPVARVVALPGEREREEVVLAALRRRTRIRADDEALLEPSSRLAPWRGVSASGR